MATDEAEPKLEPPTRTQRLRVALSSWRLWVVIAYVILFIVLILGGVTYTRESTDRAARVAAQQARYTECVRSIPFTMKVNRFLRGVKTVGGVLLLNSAQMHAITPPGSAAYRQQGINLRRLRNALHDQGAITAFPVPTPASCLADSRHAS